MKVIRVSAVLAAALMPCAAFGALFTENFDVDPTASWTVNNNGIGTNAADFFFDYSTVGIPPAPNSGGTTRGLKIGANLGPAPATGIPGISVSPTGESFTGDYTLQFDWWHNFIGPLDVGATGSTMLSTYGVLSSGTSPNLAGAADSVFFAATGDGQSSADYRIYSSQVPTSHLIPDPGGFATYAAGDRNASAALYTGLFPAGATAPGSQAAIATQSGMTSAGAAGFRWHDVKITKSGSVVTWTVNGTLLGTIDTAGFTTPTSGTNILFGHSDTNSSTNPDAAAMALLAFTLIDNVRVIPEPSSLALLAFGLSALLWRRR
jgi:hypothetical protein